jgi:hypothetical protein
MTSLLVILALVAVAAAVYYYNKTNKPVAPISKPKTPKAKTPKPKTGGGSPSEDNSVEIDIQEVL